MKHYTKKLVSILVTAALATMCLPATALAKAESAAAATPELGATPAVQTQKKSTAPSESTVRSYAEVKAALKKGWTLKYDEPGHYWRILKNNSKTGELIASNSVFPPRWSDIPYSATPKVYHLYNSSNKDHLYTIDKDEVKSAKREGWKMKGKAWTAPAPMTSTKPVYRLHNEVTGKHYYTTSVKQRDKVLRKAQWYLDRVAFYSDPSKGKPVYRMHKAGGALGDDRYVTSKKQRSKLKRAGWEYKGVAWYAIKAKKYKARCKRDKAKMQKAYGNGEYIPVYCIKSTTGYTYFTNAENLVESINEVGDGEYEGIAFYVPSTSTKKFYHYGKTLGPKGTLPAVNNTMVLYKAVSLDNPGAVDFNSCTTSKKYPIYQLVKLENTPAYSDPIYMTKLVVSKKEKKKLEKKGWKSYGIAGYAAKPA